MTPKEESSAASMAETWTQEVLSELVFGIAHQIRNPLSIIRSTDILSHRLKELLDFTHPLELNLKNCLPQELIEPSLPLIRERCSHQKIQIEKSYPQRPRAIRADPDRLQEALLQIILNAIEAMPEGGKLSLRVSQPPSSRTTSFQISDTGCGIPLEQLKDVVRPFFTTKHGSSGLGLSLAKKIFDAHQGCLKIENAPGKGTTVMGEIGREAASRPQR